ncbi:MAG: hypothetical protein N2645_22630 [Clostridia bacterium]|nr:hypothetical protein [Clostridia bacterium]
MNEGIKLLLSLSLSGTILAGIIFLLKPFIKNKISKSIQYYVWLVVLLRLIIPFSSEGSVMNNLFYGNPSASDTSISYNAEPATRTEDINKQSNSNPNIENKAEIGADNNDVDHSKYVKDLFNQYALYLWILGIISVLTYNITGYFRFSRQLKRSNIKASEAENEVLKALLNGRYRHVKLVRNPFVNTPLLVGIIKPCIIIPHNNFDEDQLKNILRHELTHLKRFDIVIKWFALVVSAVHWFNPFMYLIKKELNSACELACDEAVIKNLSANEKQSYGETLISVVAEEKCPSRMLQATMCEEKKGLRERLVAIMKHKKKSRVIIGVSILLFLGVVAGSIFLGAGVGGARSNAKAFFENLKDGNFEKAFEYVYYYDGPADLEPKIQYEKAKDIWLDRVKGLKEQGVYLKDYENLNVYYDDSYPKGTVELVIRREGKEVKHKVDIWFSKKGGWKVGNIYNTDVEKYDFHEAVSGRIEEVGQGSLYGEVKKLANKLGYKVVVNSGADQEIQLPKSVDASIDEFSAFLKDRNERSKKLIGKGFLGYLGQKVWVIAYGIEKDGAYIGELISFMNKDGMLGAWIDEDEASGDKKGMSDLSRITSTLVNVKGAIPTMYVNANNKGMGVDGLTMHFGLSSAIHKDVENNILKVNKGNTIKLSFEDKPKVLNVKITGVYGNEKKGLAFGEYINGNSFKAPNQLGIYFYEAEVEFETRKFYYPFKFEVTMENQMEKRLKDIDFWKVSKLGIIEREWIEKQGKVIEKPERILEYRKGQNGVETFIKLMNNPKINEYIFLDRTPANFKIKIYFEDGTWMNCYYWLNEKEYNFNIENVRGEITIFNTRVMEEFVLGLKKH